jgi:lipopolysaccharide export system protein LptC
MHAAVASMLSDRLALAFPIFVVALLAALTLWLDQIVQTGTAAGAAARHDPDFIVEDFVSTQTGLDGLTRHTLRADRMLHYVDDDSTHLAQPRLVHFTDKRLAVNAISDTARMSSDGEEVLLTGNVRLTRAPTANQSELVLLTTSLLVTPNKGFARTADPVVIQNATSHTDAVGLEFDYNTRQLTLLRDVRTTFRPGP